MNDGTFELPSPPWIVGHRGAAGEAPENTVPSLLLAVDQGADMVEFDLQLTADGALVLHHDWTLERMAGVDRAIEGADLDELSDLDVGGPFRRESAPVTLATLAQALEALPASLPLNLELKRRDAPVADFADRLAATLPEHRAVLVSSFDWALLTAVRERLPGLPLAPLGGRRVDPAALLDVADELDAWSVHCRHTVATDTLVGRAMAAGRPVLTYTVNDGATARDLFDRGVAGVFTDFPGRLRAQLAAEKG